jgi:hypothetical protein
MSATESAPRVIKRPLPNPPPESLPFWEGAKEHRLMLPRCNACGKSWFPPSRRCTHCLSDDTRWIEASGKGRIHSFVTVHRVYHAAFAEAVPYIVAFVELAEGPRMLTNIVGVAPEDARCGMPVAVVFDDIEGWGALPKFAPPKDSQPPA